MAVVSAEARAHGITFSVCSSADPAATTAFPAATRLPTRGRRTMIRRMEEFTVRPDPDAPRLTRRVAGIDHTGRPIETAVVVERPLTLFLNGQEIVTMMTIGDHPDYLAVGYLLNQNMLRPDDRVTQIDYDADLETVVVRTERRTNFEKKLRKKTLTSGCAQGTMFGDLMEKLADIRLPEDAILRTSWLYALSRKINTAPSLYLAAGAIHGCVLCEGDRPLVYMEDVGRHNAIDKIAGYMHMNGVGPEGKIFYTTGRLTSEMVIKTVQMRIPILISRSGFTAWGVELAREAGLTLIGRAKGKRFIALSGESRIVFDGDPAAVEEESPRLKRKASLEEEPA
jgi:FdhD protein